MPPESGPWILTFVIAWLTALAVLIGVIGAQAVKFYRKQSPRSTGNVVPFDRQ